MPTFQTKDGTSIFYKDYGTGPVVTFSHGWPLNSDAWEDQMMFLASNGYRVVAHDRRGHGKSQETWTGNDMDTYADDLGQLMDKLNVTGAVMVGHSTGGGEVTRYVGRHGTGRVAGVVLIGAVTPGMLKTEANPTGVPMEVFDGLRAGTAGDRAQLFIDLAEPFYGANRAGAKVSQGVKNTFWLQGMQGGLKAEYDCIKQFSETEYTEDLKKFDVPTLLIHGSDDQIVPIDNSAKRVAKMVQGSELKIYEGGAHGLTATEKTRINQDLLSFCQSVAVAGMKKAS